MSIQTRIQALKDLKIGYAFCPPSDDEYPTGRIYLEKAILNNPNESEALDLLAQCEAKAIIVTQARDLEEEKQLARKNEIIQIKNAIQEIKDSDKPAWEKKLLIRLAKDLRD